MKECSSQKLDKVEHNANVKFWQTAHVPLHCYTKFTRDVVWQNVLKYLKFMNLPSSSLEQNLTKI